MDIHGIKNLRLIAQRPIALLPKQGMDVSSPVTHFIEVTFDNNTVLAIPVTKEIYEAFLRSLEATGHPVEHRVSARASVALPGVLGMAPQESFLPVDQPVSLTDVEKALRNAVAVQEAAPSATTTIPATPLALERSSRLPPEPEDT